MIEYLTKDTLLSMLDYIVYLITLSGTPGPNTILSLQNASENGLRKGIVLNYGMFFGILFVSTLSYILISLLEDILPSINLYLQIFSIIYILYLSYRMYRKAKLPEVEKKSTFKDGFLLQLVNTKVMMLSVSAVSSYVLPRRLSLVDGYLLSLLIPFVCFITGLLWGITGDVLKKTYLEHRKTANIIFALSLLLLAVKNTVSLIK